MSTVGKVETDHSHVKPYVEQSRSMPWAEIALTVSVLGLAVLGTLAFFQVGSSAHLAYGAWAGAGVIAIIELALCISRCRKQPQSTGEIKYSRNGLSVEKKLAKQMIHAILDKVTNGDGGISQQFEEYPPGGTMIIVTQAVIDCNTVGISDEINKNYKEVNENAFLHRPLDHGETQIEMIGVFDGHGDDGNASGSVRDRLPQALQNHLPSNQPLSDEVVTDAITRAMIDLEKDYSGRGGTTATCAFIIDQKVYIANVGDSRTILVKSESEYQLSEDAKPSNRRFTKKVDPRLLLEKSTKIAVFSNGTRVEVDVARDIGIEGLNPRPKITRISRSDTQPDNPDEGEVYFQAGNYLVLACDGLWDVATTEEVAEIVRAMDSDVASPADISSYLAEAAKGAGSMDNITVAVVKL